MLRIITIILILAAWTLQVQAQVVPARPTEIVKGTYLGTSRPLRDIPPMTAQEYHEMELKGLKRTLNKDLKNRLYPFAATALPRGIDTFRQDFPGTNTNRAPVLNFDGQTSPYYPPDCNGTAGPNHFMQTINCVYAIYDKTGTLVAGPTDLNLLFGSVPGANRNDGDPIILYDEQADRWLVTEFSIPFSGPNYMLMAVSTTNDPTGTWHQYSFQVSSLPDYPKFSVWQDGYYMGDNNTSGNDIYVFERNAMLTGAPAQVVGFNNPWRPSSVDDFMCVPPVDNDGAFAPAGMPGLFIAFNDDAIGGGTDQLWIYELDVDWTTPANSTFQRVQQVDVQPFNSNFGNNWNNIEQKGVSQRVDAIPQVVMNVPQYRNFGSYQTIVCCHTINMDGVRHAGIRWYELRKSTGDWEVRQQGTYSPDAHSRWMGSICLNGHNEIGLGYSVSSTNLYPSIYFCGQSAGEYAAASGILDIAEDTIWVGAYSQTGANRWGDYSQMSVDPADDKTFWFTTQYIGSGSSRKTRIASFKYNFAPEAVTKPATDVTYATAKLHGTVNPNGLETTWHFEYGHTPLSMSILTPPVAGGSGSVPVEVSADISGLLSDTNYFFRIVAESDGGTGTGLRVKFTTPAAPFLSVTPPNHNAGAASGEAGFAVASNVSWSVTSPEPWCTLLTPASGTGSDTIRVAFQENATVNTRIAGITVTSAETGAQVVTITQQGAAPMLSVTPPARTVGPASGNTGFDVISNLDWMVTSDAPWCTVNPSGSGAGTITAAFEENQVAEPRTATLTVSAAGLPAVTVTVNQEGAVPTLSVTPSGQAVGFEAGSTSFTVNSNAAWTTASPASWCTITPSGSGNGTIVVDYALNGGDQPRIAEIGVTVPGLPVQVVTVTQARSGIGVAEVSSDDIAIYPNPTKGIVMVVPGRSFLGGFNVSVQDITGVEILTRQCQGAAEYRLDLSPFAAGTYNIVIRTEQKTIARKLVVTD